jgi:formylglycine-generating enzyme required for sulfatase activity
VRDFIRTSALRTRLGIMGAALIVLSSVVYVAPQAVALNGEKPKSPDTPLPTVTDTLPNSLVKWEMIQIPAGTIEMPDPANPGAKKPVQIKRIWMGKAEILWDLYDIYAFRLDLTDEEKAKNVDAASRPSKPYGAPDRGFGHQGYPALSMHHNAAEFFCKWLSKKTGKKYRLPTEAEWEYACRAGATSIPKYDDKSLEDIAWYWENADDKTHPSGTKKPNAWGFVDMLGNAAEWVIMPDGKGALAGGSYNDKTDKIQPGFRDFYKPEWQSQDAHTPKSKWWLSDGPFVGMRIVRED